MKRVSQQIDDILLTYLDDKLTSEQRSQVEAMLLDETIRHRFDELKEMHNLMQSPTLFSPSINFTNNVMKGIMAPPRTSYFSILKSVWLLIGIVVVIIATGILLHMGIFDQSTTSLSPGDIGLPGQYLKQDIPSIQLDGKYIVYGIVLLNLVVGFLILDRAILKPFFERRMQAGNDIH